MDIATQFELETSFEVLHVRLIRILHDDLLRLDGLNIGHTAVGQLYCPDSRWDPGYCRNACERGDGTPTLEVHDVGHRLLSDNWN